MAAIVAALLAQVSDRTPWAVAALGDRYDEKGAVIAGVALALAFGNAVGEDNCFQKRVGGKAVRTVHTCRCTFSADGETVQ